MGAHERLLHVESREKWRRWLAAHHADRRQVWLVFYRRHTGRPRVEYEDAVQEALCVGWIDSLVKRLDADRYAQKFTPRRADSTWSAVNRRRFARLVADGQVQPAGLAVGPAGRRPRAAPRATAGAVPAYLRRALRANERARAFFNALAPSYRRLYVDWIDSARREDTRDRRLAYAIEKLARGEKLGLK